MLALKPGQHCPTGGGAVTPEHRWRWPRAHISLYGQGTEQQQRQQAARHSTATNQTKPKRKTGLSTWNDKADDNRVAAKEESQRAKEPLANSVCASVLFSTRFYFHFFFSFLPQFLPAWKPCSLKLFAVCVRCVCVCVLSSLKTRLNKSCAFVGNNF